MGKEIILKNISKQYGTTTVLEDINLEIEAGQRVVLLGPSGSGKSTLLRMIAGLETISSGQLFLGGEEANLTPCGQREIAMVFQNYALYPHMTVAENITFALKANKVKAEIIKNRLDEALAILGLTHLAERLPRELSGGQRQRTALARAIVKKSDYFLLDEPLSNLDVMLRQDARKELVKLHKQYNPTFIYVTHDQIEAMTLADKIVVLNNGNIQMFATPKEIYHRPANVFTASFIGSPGMNIIPLERTYEQFYLGQNVVALTSQWQVLVTKHGGDVMLGIRPEHIEISPKQGRFSGTICYKELLGQDFALTVNVGGHEMTVLTEDDRYQLEQEVYLDFPQQHLHFFSAETQKNIGYPN